MRTMAMLAVVLATGAGCGGRSGELWAPGDLGGGADQAQSPDAAAATCAQKKCLLVEVLTASASADLMPPLPGRMWASLQLEFANKHDKQLTGIKLKEAAMYAGTSTVSKLLNLGLKGGTAFSGKLAPGKRERRDYSYKDTSWVTPCKSKVKIGGAVGYDQGPDVAFMSKAFEFGCLH